MVTVSFLPVLVVAIVFFIIGFIWHGPMFGKAYMKAMDLHMDMTPEQKKAMQKKMMPTYILQIVLSFITVYVLAHFIKVGVAGGTSAVGIAFWIWLGFLMPLAAASAMWSGKPKNSAWMLFFITAGYNLVTIIIGAWILSVWK